MFASQNLRKSYGIISQSTKYASQFAKCEARSWSQSVKASVIW